ncbi:hypothetical protein SAMN04487898_12377 [Pedobacter sp. ok626]|nr:hypothetical protein SAMN04487898_12377 [Pedobacter sp. ok626]
MKHVMDDVQMESRLNTIDSTYPQQKFILILHIDQLLPYLYKAEKAPLYGAPENVNY